MANKDLLPVPAERHLTLDAQVTQDSMSKLKTKILEINKDDAYLKKFYKLHNLYYKPKPIKIYIDSYGGMCYQCMGLLGVMANSKTPIHTIAAGAAMSCGFIILISGHKRFSYRRFSTPMYHQVSTGFWGKIKDMEEDLEETKRLQRLIEDETLAKTKIPKAEIDHILETKKDWFMTPEEALEFGVVDKLI